MYAFRLLLSAGLALAISSAPVLAQAPSPNTLGYTWWSSATNDQKQLVVRGEIDGIPSGYLEPVIILGITGALTGNATVNTLLTNLKKTPPVYSKTPEQYVVAIDAVYTKPDARKLSLSTVMLCLTDKPFGADTIDGCI